MSKQKELKILYFPVGGNPKVKTIPNTLEALQEQVEGYIECVHPDADVIAICNEEGLLRNMPFNRKFGPYPMVGPVILVVEDGEHFGSLTDEQIEHYKKKYWNPQILIAVRGLSE